jgi:GNAT superfamily N-acetyltransferase
MTLDPMMSSVRPQRDMKWRTATSDDAQMLGQMNLRLIQDEKHRNPMAVTQLVQRMRDFLSGNYKAVIFEDDAETLGYALFHPQEDFLYLRQFFIERHRRREGNGRAAMKLLMDHVFPAEQRLVVTVLATNPDALNFWRAVGFADYCTSLEILPRAVAEPCAPSNAGPGASVSNSKTMEGPPSVR